MVKVFCYCIECLAHSLVRTLVKDLDSCYLLDRTRSLQLRGSEKQTNGPNNYLTHEISLFPTGSLDRQWFWMPTKKSFEESPEIIKNVADRTKLVIFLYCDSYIRDRSDAGRSKFKSGRRSSNQAILLPVLMRQVWGACNDD